MSSRPRVGTAAVDELPDKAALDNLAFALWEGSRPSSASLMVGAGFSLNATPVTGRTRSLPMWEQLTEVLRSELDTAEPDARKVASLYAAAFGQSQLDARIIEHIPDLMFEPGALHNTLLKLPWADVFTTNYDTLLERAASNVSVRKYDPVYSAEDLTSTRRPRIVKLHGSFPSQRPFILTEEHFRRYPITHAPFVNTVQQALLESTLCLVGFSGTDPNFIAWSGWVRDFLQDHTRTIYLLGVLDLPVWERAYLADRKITAIDLGPLVPEDTPDRHRRALETAFAYLHARKPLPPWRWPKNLRDGLRRTEEPDGVPTVDELLPALRELRSSFPGWVVAPRLNRPPSADIQKALRTDKELQYVELLAMHGWALRKQLRSQVGHGEWIGKLVDALRPFLKGRALVLNSANRNAVEDVALDLLQIAREGRLEIERAGEFPRLFEEWTGILKATADLSSEGNARFYWERSLFHLQRFETDPLMDLVSSWPSSADPFNNVRRALILAELEREDEAIELVTETLQRVRAIGISHPRKRDIYHLSREGWCLFFLDVAHTTWARHERFDRDGTTDRLAELAAFRCDPWELITALEHNCLKPHEQLGPSYKPGFWPGSGKTTTRFGNNVAPVPTYLRTLEDGAVPVGLRGVNVVPAEVSQRFADDARLSPSWVFSTLLRDGNAKVLDQWLSRHRVAAMPDDWFAWLSETVHRMARNRFESFVANSNELTTNRLDYTFKVLARMSVREQDEQVCDSMDLFLSLFEQAECPRRDFPNDGTLELIRGLIENSRLATVGPHLSRLAALPICESDGPYRKWSDPLGHLKIGNEALEPKTQRQIEESGVGRGLLTTLVSSSETPHRRAVAAMRLYVLFRLESLDDSTVTEFGRGFWQALKNDGFLEAVVEKFALATLLRMPDDSGGDYSDLLARLLLTPRFEGELKSEPPSLPLERRVREVRGLLDSASVPLLAWDASTVRDFIDRLVSFVTRDVPEWREDFFGVDDTASLLFTVGMCVQELGFRFQHDSEAVDLLHRTINQFGHPTAHLVAARLATGVLDSETAADELCTALQSSSKWHMRGGLIGLERWFLYSTNVGYPLTAPLHLLLSRLRDIRRLRLREAIDTTTRIVSCPGFVLGPDTAALMTEGLHRLLEETEMSAETIWRIGADPPTYQAVPFELRPDVRWRAARLAAQIAQIPTQDTRLTDVLQRWRDACASSNLPEVRRAWLKVNALSRATSAAGEEEEE